jgi:predicted DNA-binding transcriptional regulator YafY
MEKSRRLIELMMVVNDKKRFTAQELADEFNVSYRTMLRDLHELSELGVPLYAEPGMHGGYRIVKERIIPPIAFSENEAVALFFIHESLRYYGGIPFEIERESILRKFHHYLPNDIKTKIEALKDRVVFWNPVREQSSKVLTQILEAALHQKVVLIDYQSTQISTKRKVQFVGLYAYNGFWYCPAFCFQKQAFRLFRGDRIETVSPVEREAKDLSGVALADWLKEEAVEKKIETLPLHVFLTSKGIRRFSSDLTFGNQIEMNEDGTGKLETNIMRNQIQYCADLLFGLGQEAKIIEPAEVIQEIKRRIEQVRKLYV